MGEDRNWNRLRERLELKLPVRVHCRETADFEWEEMTRLINVTPFGAGFTLKRPTERGRLLHMTIPMPRQLRVFDHVEDQYRVWALVRYIKQLEAEPNKPMSFDIGVAFIGKHAPRSYESDPSRRYEVASSSGDSLTLKEITEAAEPPSADQRVHTRHNIPVDVSLELLNAKGDVAHSEKTVTENISNNGATVFTSLSIPVGRFVRLTSHQYNLTIHGAVRRRSTGGDGIPRVHLEFVDREWPL